MSEPTFGQFARQCRQSANLGLRQASRSMGISAAYLSRVESNTDPPSPVLLHKMSQAYNTPIGELAAKARARDASGYRSAAAAHGLTMESNAELRALYRMGTRLSPEKVQTLLRQMLSEEGFSDEDIERELARLRSELPRVSNNGRDGLFATEARPRRLSKARIAEMAARLLHRNGLCQENYDPPTPVELIVESESGIAYKIARLKCDKYGRPVVLGLTGWDDNGNRQIIVNSALADGRSECDERRFNFTLAHELFHAIEHLPRVPNSPAAPLARMQVFVDTHCSKPRSIAEKAVSRWAGDNAGPQSLKTDEDWREWQSNTFASALLMPDYAILGELRKRGRSQAASAGLPLNPREIALQLADERFYDSGFYEHSLADRFAVSRQAMAIRLLELGVVREV